MGVGDGERVVLHAARLTAWKGQRVAIDAAAELQAQGTLSGTVFLLAGDAQGRESYAAELRSRIETAGLQGKVRLVGHCADMPAAYAMAHVTVVPSIEAEAFGRVSAEAQAMGCPVIASNLGASPEVVRVARQAGETATGWLVPAGDAGALAAAIAHALALPEGEREAMGIAARAHVMRSFSVDALRRATLAVYDELLGTSLAAAYKESLWP
jgi:glycosyltransferase involved in cell wall biosynthesis